MTDPRSFIDLSLSDDETHFDCPMPRDSSFVDVRLDDGTVASAYFETNIMDAGDWDFMTVVADGETPDSLSDRVRAWRYSREAKP